MKINKILIVVCFLLSILNTTSFAQNTEPKLLVHLLPVLEEQFDIVFTFADENIKGIFVVIPYKHLSLDECLGELNKQTHLNFKKLNSRYITIQMNIHDISLSASVIDKYTKEPLVGSLIYSDKTYAYTDKNGWFSIRLNEKRDSCLSISYTGYKTLHLTGYDWSNNSLIYELTPDVQALNEVLVNYIVKGIDKLAGGYTQVNIHNLEILPGLPEPDVLHAVQVLPGIQSINETVSNINIRGGTNDQNLLLWDGVKMYQTGHFFGLVSAFNSHLIDKTNIVMNGTSVVFDEGVSGVIDMQQQDYSVNKLKISTGLNMMSADMIIKAPVSKKLSFIFGARHSINNIILTPTYKSYYKRAFEDTEVLLDKKEDDRSLDNYHDFSFYDLSCKFFYDISEKDKVRLSLLNVDNNIEYEESALMRDTLYRKTSYLKQSSILSNLSYTRSWTKKHTTQLSAFVSYYFLDALNVSILDNDNHLQENEVTDWGIKLNTENKIGERLALLSGYQFKEVGVRNKDNISKPGYKRDAKDVLRIHSLYTEAEFSELFHKLYLRAGIRTNYYSEFKTFSLEPRLALNIRLNKYISLEALAEKKSQYTSQVIDYQTDFLGVEKRKWILSNNESVPLLKSQQFSIGMIYNRKSFLVSLEVYNKRVSGIITPSQGFQNQYQYVYSIGKYNAQGVELLVNKRFNKFNIWLNYTLAQNDYSFKEFTPSNFPNKLDVRHTISLGGNYTSKHIELSCGLNYRTGKPYTKAYQESVNGVNELVYESPNSSLLEDYIRLDISAKYHFNIRDVKGELGVSAWNVLNRTNLINVYYQQNHNREIERVTQNALRFTPNISLRFRF